MTTADYTTATFPPDPFTVIVADDEVLASGWTDDPDHLLRLIHSTIRPFELRKRSRIGDISVAIERYHDGDLSAIDDVPVSQHSVSFISAAWDALRKVPAGQPVSYTELAALAGRPLAVRAAASACARNTAALFVPCHRVVRSDGSLGGFRWGNDVKRWLLDHEARNAHSSR